MPNLGGPELAIALAVFILLFGAKKLPELGSAIGQTVRNLKAGVQETAEPAASAEQETA